MTIQLPNDLLLDNDFWQFSLSLWQNKKAQAVLLRLQNEHALRVNLLLFSMWLALEKKDINLYILTALKRTESWHQEVVMPLRSVRQTLPSHTPIPSLKPQVQASELLAEQIEQSLLYQCSRSTASPHNMMTNCAKSTLSILVKNILACSLHSQTIAQMDADEVHQNKKFDTVSTSDLLLLVQACLPLHPAAEISACIESLTKPQ